MSIRNLFLALFIFILASNKVYAQVEGIIVPDPSDTQYTVAPGTAGTAAQSQDTIGTEDDSILCGYVYPVSGVETNKCCSYSAAKTDVTKYLEGDWGCVNFLYIKKFCISDMLPSALTLYNKVNSLLKIDTFADYPKCKTGKPSGDGDSCVCTGVTDQKMCDRYLNNSSEAGEAVKCSACMSSDQGYYSALGCIRLDSFSGLIAGGILTPLLSLGGLAAFLIIIYAAILIMTSSGDPERIKKAKEMLTSALVGLLFIILSIFILKFISGDLLGISLKGGK